MKVYMTYRNADMIEGRGPMLSDKCFMKKIHADQYIDCQPGIMGSFGRGNGWEVEEIEVIEYSLIDAKKKQEELKALALNKLSKE